MTKHCLQIESFFSSFSSFFFQAISELFFHLILRDALGSEIIY